MGHRKKPNIVNDHGVGAQDPGDGFGDGTGGGLGQPETSALPEDEEVGLRCGLRPRCPVQRTRRGDTTLAKVRRSSTPSGGYPAEAPSA